ncbi:hypothetical protein CKO28_14570 [Rhodovibrio sodomensis]|uniref:PD-(D/E)XK endonuclease-like domain-containing protein n=1 Tax=Rhodovibrio sodomensis TaxID=1088 RepID=A0ABS1DIC0_9PROT|nr:hypothetical protein [Rhodovibrio sodomensis]MBK1669258.1 hypothetical protein [Rhodovibrio sodomensis]
MQYEEYEDGCSPEAPSFIKLTPDGNQLLIWEDLPGGERRHAKWSLDDAYIIATEAGYRVENLEALRSVTERDRSLEADLTTMKWFDYRYLTPAAATRLFAATYTDCYRRIWREQFDKDEAALKRPLRNDDPFRVVGPELTNLWRARQWADGLAYPYDFFIHTTFQFARKRGYKRPPLPNQLFGAKMIPKLTPALAMAWRRSMESRARYGTSANYRNENYCGDPAQDAHHAHILNLLRAKGPRPLDIRRFVFDERLLPEQRAVAEFGRELVERGRAQVPTLEEPPVYRKIKATALKPGCYGLPGADQGDWPCTACRFRVACRRSADLVSQTAAEVWGTDDPRAADHRAKAAARKRKERARKRASAAATR